MGTTIINPYRFAGGTQAVSWNSADKAANVTLSNSDMNAAASAGGAWVGVRATLGRSTDLFYWEMDVVLANSTSIIAGFMSSGANLQYPGQSANGAGVRRAGKFCSGWTHANTTAPGGTDTNGDRWMFAANLNNGKLWCGVNNSWTSGDPAADTTPWVTGVTGTIYPAVGFFATSATARLVVDAAQFSYSPPSGFSAWNIA